MLPPLLYGRSFYVAPLLVVWLFSLCCPPSLSLPSVLLCCPPPPPPSVLQLFSLCSPLPRVLWPSSLCCPLSLSWGCCLCVTPSVIWLFFFCCLSGCCVAVLFMLPPPPSVLQLFSLCSPLPHVLWPSFLRCPPPPSLSWGCCLCVTPSVI